MLNNCWYTLKCIYCVNSWYYLYTRVSNCKSWCAPKPCSNSWEEEQTLGVHRTTLLLDQCVFFFGCGLLQDPDEGHVCEGMTVFCKVTHKIKHLSSPGPWWRPQAETCCSNNKVHYYKCCWSFYLLTSFLSPCSLEADEVLPEALHWAQI